MSSDNGIYILKTLTFNGGWEYRVTYLQDVGSYRWNYLMKNADDAEYGPGGYTEDSTCHMFNARRMWVDCKVFKTFEEASVEAFRQYQEIGYTEYGVTEICIPQIWNSSMSLADDAVKQLQLAMAFISGELDYKKWTMDNLMDTRISNFTTYMLQRIETKLPEEVPAEPILVGARHPQY